MVERSSNCLLDGLCEIIIRVQILVPLSYTGRPFEPLLLAIDQNMCPNMWGADNDCKTVSLGRRPSKL